MSNQRFIGAIVPKKSIIPGRVPTGSTLGEIFSNLADKKIWGYDGYGIFEYGSQSFLSLTGGTVNTLDIEDGILSSGLTNLYDIFVPFGTSTTVLTPTYVGFGSTNFTLTGSTNLKFINDKLAINGSSATLSVDSFDTNNPFRIEIRNNSVLSSGIGTQANFPFTIINYKPGSLTSPIIASNLFDNVIIWNKLFIGGTNNATAFLDLSGSNLQTSSFRIHSGQTPLSLNDGDINYNGNNLITKNAGITSAFILDNGNRLTNTYFPIAGVNSRLVDSVLIQNSNSGITVNGDLSIVGDFFVLGTATTINTATVSSSSNQIMLNLSGNHLSAVNGGIIVLSGQPGGQSSNWLIDIGGNWSANTNIITQGISVVNGGQILSGGTNLYDIFGSAATSNVILANGINTYTASTSGLTSVNLINHPVISGLTIANLAGINDRLVQSDSGGTISANLTTIIPGILTDEVVIGLITNNSNWDVSGNYTGTTLANTYQGQVYSDNFYYFVAMNDNSFIRVNRSVSILTGGTGGSSTFIQPGLNIYTGGTSTAPTINVSAATLNYLSAVTISGNTYYSGSTPLQIIIQNIVDASELNDITRVQPGTNITTGGTGNAPIINITDSPSFNIITASGTSQFASLVVPNLSANTLSYFTSNSFTTNANNGLFSTFTATTYFSGNTTLSQAITNLNDGNDITRIQPGLNTYTGGTGNAPTINVSAATLNSLSAATVSGGTLFSGSTNLYDIFSPFGSNYLQPTEIAFGASTSAITSSSNFNYSNSDKQLNIDGTLVIGKKDATNDIVASFKNNLILGSAFQRAVVILSDDFTARINASSGTKVDNPMLIGDGFATPTAYLDIFTSTTINSALRIRSGQTPSIINDGAIWSDGMHLYGNFGNSTKVLDDVVRIQPGTNILTGGTGNAPVINLSSDPVINSLELNDLIVDSSITLMGSDIFGLFAPFGTPGDITRIQPGLNTYTGGTGNAPTINVSAATLNSLSAATVSGGTLFSGSTNLYDIFSPFGSSGSVYLPPNQVAFGSALSAVASSASFIWDESSKEIAIDGTMIVGRNNGASDIIVSYKDSFVIGGAFLRSVLLLNSDSTMRLVANEFKVGAKTLFGDSLMSPTSTVDIFGSVSDNFSSGYTQLRIRSGVTPTTIQEGSVWNDGTSLNINNNLTIKGLSGSTNRTVQVNSGGTLSATDNVITDSAAIGLLTASTNWNLSGHYTGTTLTNTYQGQFYTNDTDNYVYLAYADNKFARILRG